MWGPPNRSDSSLQVEIERYALFGPSEIFSERSADLRRVDPAVVGMSFDEVFSSIENLGSALPFFGSLNWDNGKENGNYYSILVIWVFYWVGFRGYLII